MDSRVLAELAADPSRLDDHTLAEALMEHTPPARWPELARLLGRARVIVGLRAIEHLDPED